MRPRLHEDYLGWYITTEPTWDGGVRHLAVKVEPSGDILDFLSCDSVEQIKREIDRREAAAIGPDHVLWSDGHAERRPG
jgi:hypothetical protein